MRPHHVAQVTPATPAAFLDPRQAAAGFKAKRQALYAKEGALLKAKVRVPTLIKKHLHFIKAE